MKNLWKCIKNFIKRFYPLTIYRFNQRTQDELSEIRMMIKEIANQVVKEELLEIRKMTKEIIDQSTKKELQEIRAMTKGIIDSDFIHFMPKAELTLEVHIAEHCNLNCAGCGHFSPLAEPEFADVEEIAQDFARLSSLFHGHIRQLRLMGGEPLLHPDIISFLKIARENFCDGDIAIITNGILLLNQPEEFWLACKEYRISIRPTKYPISLDYEKIEKRAADYGVEYCYYNNAAVIKTLQHYKKDIKGLQDGSRSFLHCSEANNCMFLQHGKVYTCPVVASVRHFNNFFGEHFKELPEDSIDIYQVDSAREILEFLARPIPFCRYCMMENTIWHLPFHQSKQAIEEWI